MEFPLARTTVPELRVETRAGSTNSVLLDLAGREPVPSWTTVVTTDQTAGRGRLDREWVAAPGDALAISVLVREISGRDWMPWIPLAAGVAMTDAVAALVGGAARLKWPNDVLVGGAKISGILAEIAPGGHDVVIGAGVNLRQGAADLPVATATSLALVGVTVTDAVADELLARYLSRLRELLDGEPSRAALRRTVLDRCLTIGRMVSVDPLGGSTFTGRAVDLDEDGRLRVEDDAGRVHTVAAADVVHARAV